MTEAPDDAPEGSVVPRLKNGRPQIWLPDHSKLVSYTRTSNFAKTLEDGGSLTDWKLARMATGIARRPDLQAGLERYWDTDRTSGGMVQELTRESRDEFIESCLDAGGANDASRWGTSLHGLTELWDEEQYEIPGIDPRLADGLEAYKRLLDESGMIPLAIEGFVVQDDLKCAGSYDRLYLLPDGRIVVGDIKTAPLIHQPSRFTAPMIQMAVYAHSMHYDPRDGSRHPLVYADSDIVTTVDQTLAVVVQISRDRTVDQLLWADLDRGWSLAAHAAQTRASRSNKPYMQLPPADPFMDFELPF